MGCGRGLELFLTDRAWSQAIDGFVPNTVEGEGIVSYTTPPGGITAGVTFGMANNTLIGDTLEEWIDVDVNSTLVNTSQYLELGEDGDQLFLYCVGSDGRDRPISAFSYGRDFLRPIEETSDTVYGTTNSSAPSYFFEPLDPESTISSNTPGMLEMPQCYNDQVYWYWEFDSPSGVVNFYDLRNLMSESGMWFGENPDGSRCSSATTASVSGLVVGMMMLVWLLAAV